MKKGVGRESHPFFVVPGPQALQHPADPDGGPA